MICESMRELNLYFMEGGELFLSTYREGTQVNLRILLPGDNTPLYGKADSRRRNLEHLTTKLTAKSSKVTFYEFYHLLATLFLNTYFYAKERRAIGSRMPAPLHKLRIEFNIPMYLKIPHAALLLYS